MSANISVATEHRGERRAIVVFLFCMVLVAVLGRVGHVTGPEIGLTAFYMLPIALATWFGGTWAGGIVALASGGAWYYSNASWADKQSSSAILHWNASMRLLIFFAMAGMTAVARHGRQKIESTVQERTIALAAEIGERKRAEEELRAERDFAESLIATARAIVLLLDNEGRIVRFNPYLEELSGYSLDEVKGRDWISTFLPPDSQEGTRRVLSKAIGGVPTRGNISPLVTKDGRILKIEWHDKLLLDAEGHPIGLLSVGQDITERIRAEEEMHWKTALLEAQINATIDGILIVDKEGRVLVQNQRCIELWNIPQYVVDNNDDGEHLRFVKNRTVDPEAFVEKVVYLYSHPDETSHDEVEFKDGTVLDRYSAPVIASDGRCFGRIWVFRDITERKRAEETLQAIIQTSKDWIWAMDAAGVHTFSNAAIEHILGYGPGELTGEAYREYMHPDDLEAARDAVVRGIAEKRGWSNKVLRWRAKSGAYRFLESNAVPVLDREGRVAGFRGVDRDITERKRADEALKASETRYRRLFESAKDGILILDGENGAIVDVNPFLTELLGFSREQMLGKKVWELGFLRDILSNQANFAELRQKEYIRYEDLPLETADGRRIDVEFVSNVYPVNGRNVIQCNIRDITERKQAEEKIKALAKFPEENPDVVLRIAADGRLLYINPAAREQLSEWSLKIGGPVPDPLREAAGHALGSGLAQAVEIEVNGRIFAFHISAIVEAGYANLYARDITDRKRAEEALRESEHYYREIINNTADAVFVHDLSGSLVDCNRRACESLGYSREELLRLAIGDIEACFSQERDVAEWNRLKPGMTCMLAGFHKRKDRSVFPVEVNMVLIARPGKGMVVAVARDISERAESEERLRDSERRYREFFALSRDCVFITTGSGKWIAFNDAALEVFGYDHREELSQTPVSAFYESQEERSALLDAIGKQGHVEEYPIKLRRRDGTVIDALITAAIRLSAKGAEKEYYGTIRDVTKRKKAEENLRQTHRALLAVTACNEVIMRAAEEPGLLHDICRIIVEMGGYHFAWVGFAERDAEKTVRPVAFAGHEDGFLKAVSVSWAEDNPTGRGPTGVAIRLGKPVVVADMHADPGYSVWYAQADERGYRASAALPLVFEGEPIGILTVYSEIPDAFSEEEVKLLTELANDVAFGIHALRAETARVKAENELLLKNALLEAGSETSPDGILAVDEQGTTILFNRRFAKMWGIPLDVLEAGNDKDERLRIISKRLCNPEKFLAGVEHLYSHPEEKSRDELELKDGKYFERYSSPLVDRNGKHSGRIWYFRDITVRKRAEVALKSLSLRQEAILSAVPDIIMEVDVNKVYTWANAAGVAFFGDDVIGRDASSYFVGEQNVYERVEPVFNGTENAVYIESWQRRKDGEKRLLAWWCRTLNDEHGHVLGGLSSARDITEYRQAEEARQNLESQLYQAQKMESVGRLAGGVAHDFNNILTGIMGYAQLGLDKLDTASPVCEYLDETRRLAVRAADLTQQLLAFSRRQPLSMQVLNLNDVTGSACGVLKRMIGEDIDFQFVPAPDLGNIRADAGQIEQILMNLVINARDAMPTGGKLTIETMNVELDAEYAGRHVGVTPGPYAMLVVSDTGHGMDAATKEHAFDPFFTTKEKGKGTGLGLATVYGIVKQHGGNIWVYSEEGKGTSFKVYLPQVAEEVADINPQPEPKVATGGETILVVEDETSVRAIAERVLRKHGYAVVTAGSAEEAERVFSEHQNEIALVLTDVVLPGMNGRRLCELLTIQNPSLRVIYMSGYADNAIVHHGVLDDGVAFIQKPFTPEMIARKVRQVLDS